MKELTIKKALAGNTYPGRGILMGIHRSNDFLVMAYFIMGRSVNSRNRIFEMDPEDDGMHTEAADPSLLEDPSLVIYSAMKLLDQQVVITNGDQTDTIADFLRAGNTFESALRTRCYEPDPPHFTPRISGLMDFSRSEIRYKLSILKTGDGDETQSQRFFFDYTGKAGLGHLIHTYQGDGDPRLPSFEGEPRAIRIDGSIDQFTERIWEALDPENRVSLMTSFLDRKSGRMNIRITNRHQKAPE